MAHIVRIKIEGLLGRSEPIELALDRHVNVFFGENGCGKTTLLKVIQSALTLDGNSMASLPVERAEVDIYTIKDDCVLTHTWDRKGNKRQQISLDLMTAIEDSTASSIEDRRHLFHLQTNNSWKVSGPKKSKTKLPSYWTHRYLPTTRLYIADSNKRLVEPRSNGEDRFNEAFAEEVNKRWLVYYNQTLKEVKKIQEEGLRAVLYHSLAITSEVCIGPIINPQQAYQRVKQFLSRQAPSDSKLLGSEKNFVTRYESDESLRRVVDNINNVEERIESAMAPILQFTATTNNLFSRNKKIQPYENGLEVVLSDGKKISPALLSSGEKHLLIILLNAMTVGESTIIIDEPELSMHIDWQHVLAETINILNPKCQLILASHSPEIMAEIDDGNIFKL